MVTVVCRTPMREVSRAREKETWCFRCRQRRQFDRVIVKPTDPMSYYEPHVYIECNQRHVDGDLFPGHSREW